LEEERVRGNIRHRYYFLYVILARVGVLALFIPAVLLVEFYRPSYNTVDVIVMLAVGMILGAVYVRSQDRLAEYYAHRLQEAEKKTANAKTT
jgi:vancomycin permeability regulator SanA